MVYKPLQIHDAVVPLGRSNYRRPFVLATVDRHGLLGFPLSTQIETFYRFNVDFLIEKSDPDFGTTGLSVTSFVIGEQEIAIEARDIKKFRGEIAGAMASRFLKWYANG